MEDYDFETPFALDAVTRARNIISKNSQLKNDGMPVSRFRSISEGQDSGFGSYPCTNVSTPNEKKAESPQWFMFFEIQQEQAQASSVKSSCIRALSFDDTPALNRELSPKETFFIHKIAQKIAEHRIKFGHDAVHEPNSTYDSIASSLNGVVGLSTKGLPSSCVVLPPRRKSYRKIPTSFCNFCKNNEEVRCRSNGQEPDPSVWNDHRLKDEYGNCQCPKLRAHVCEFCHQSGDRAHTIRYCEEKKQQKLKFV